MKRVMDFLNTPIRKEDTKRVIDFLNTPIFGKRKTLNLRDVKVIAKTKGIDSGNLGKSEIIRAIQKAEGNFDCYGSAFSGHCNQFNCSWRNDCLK